MAFGKVTKEDVEAVVKEMYGMTADEFKAKLAKIDAMEGTVNSVKDLSTAQSGTLEEIKTSLKTISTPYSKPPEGTGGDGNPPKERPNWGEDADAAYADRSQPLVNAILDTKAMIARREAMDAINLKNPDIPWAMVADEINEKAKGSSLQQMANPAFWQNVYNVVIGENRQNIERDRNQKNGKFYTEIASSSIVVAPDDNKKPEDKLNETQVNAARKAGISPAEYAKQLDGMQVWR